MKDIYWECQSTLFTWVWPHINWNISVVCFLMRYRPLNAVGWLADYGIVTCMFVLRVNIVERWRSKCNKNKHHCLPLKGNCRAWLCSNIGEYAASSACWERSPSASSTRFLQITCRKVGPLMSFWQIGPTEDTDHGLTFLHSFIFLTETELALHWDVSQYEYKVVRCYIRK